MCFCPNCENGFPPDVTVDGFPEFEVAFGHCWKVASAGFEALLWPVDGCSDCRNRIAANGFPESNFRCSFVSDGWMYHPDVCPDCSGWSYFHYSIDSEFLLAAWYCYYSKELRCPCFPDPGFDFGGYKNHPDENFDLSDWNSIAGCRTNDCHSFGE